jgi:DICT domain-containing protein
MRMRDVVEQTGIGEATLRAWERRYGFPEPERLPSGHRRYDPADVERLRQVAQLRAGGVPVDVAIARARELGDRSPESVFAAVRKLRPDVPVARFQKRALVALSHAIEDECTYGASDVTMFGAFQRAGRYRASERRWRELSAAASTAIVFADFERVRRPRGGPVEAPIRPRDPLAREWVVLCDGQNRSACLAAWEPPGQAPAAEGDRSFDAIWTTDRETVRAAARVCCALAAPSASREVAAAAARLSEPVTTNGDELAHAEALTRRMIAYLAQAS